MRCFATEPTSHAPLSFFFSHNWHNMLTARFTMMQRTIWWNQRYWHSSNGKLCSSRNTSTNLAPGCKMSSQLSSHLLQLQWFSWHFKINTHWRLSRCTSEKCDAKGRQPSTRHVTNARSSHKSLLETPGAIAFGNWGDHHTSGLAQLQICSQAQIHPWSYMQELARHKSDTATTHIRAKCMHSFFLHYPRADRV